MILYSVTVTIDSDILEDWYSWMTEVHIPQVLATGYFTGWHFSRLLDPAPEEGTFTFNIQYECQTMSEYIQYRDTEAPALQMAHTEKFRDRFVAFRTLLEKMH